MYYTTALCFLFLAHFWEESSVNAQFYPVPFLHEESHFDAAQDSEPSESQARDQTLANFSNPTFLDPEKSSTQEEFVKNNIPRQLYGAPPPFQGYPRGPAGNPQGPSGFPQGGPSGFAQGGPSGFNQGGFSGFTQNQGGYPQIYKIDNLIIIANPPQQQPCYPYPRPPPTFPGQKPGDGGEDGLDNRISGDEPSKCTWAIVSCCAPGNTNVRYNCFELLGCPGFFFDTNPCSPTTVTAATMAALEFYRNSNNPNTDKTNTTSTGTDNNRV